MLIRMLAWHSIGASWKSFSLCPSCLCGELLEITAMNLRLVGLALIAAAPVHAQQPQIITGLKQPESVAIGPDGKVYVSETGEYEKANDGYISILEGNKLRKFATGLDDPHGIKWYKD